MSTTPESALTTFFKSLMTNAYEENAVPKDAGFPRLTYNVITGCLGEKIPLSFSIWYRSSRWADANAKARYIYNYIGESGVFLPCDGGCIWITRGTPFSQHMGDDTDNQVKRVFMSIVAEYLINT